MPALKRPGVFLEERPPLTVNPGGSIGASTGAFIGAANRGPSAPTEITSYSGFTKLFGDVVGATSELPFQVYAFFANGGSRCFVSAVRGTGAAVATKAFADRAATPVANTLTVTAKNAGTWGNDLYIDINDTAGTPGYFDLTVKLGGATENFVVERFTNLTMTVTDERYALSVVNSLVSGSAYVTLVNGNSATAAPNNNPSVITGSRLAAGANGGAPAAGDFSTALAAHDAIQEPLNMALPGASTTIQNLALTYAQNRGDIFVACELPTTVVDSASAITAAGALTATSYGAVYWPNVVVNNPASTVPGATRVQGPTGAILGLIALTDATRGIQKAPAGTAARIAGALAPAVLLNSTDLDNLNVAQVNAIRQIPGSGTVVFGARTLKPGSSDRYVPIRRSLIFVKANVIQLSQFALFEPNSPALWRRVEVVLETFLNDAWRAGVLKGASPDEAYYVICDSTNNDAASSSQGVVNVEVGVSLLSPAEFIVIKVGQFEGGASATEN